MKEYLLSNIKKIDAGYDTSCWEWQGRRDKDGYGKFKKKLVHRLLAMIFLRFDIDSKLLVCHHCDNPPCINPDHLFIGTNQDNMDDMTRKGRRLGTTNTLGYKHTEETKRKMSIAHMGNKSHTGKKFSEEIKARMSEARTLWWDKKKREKV